MNPDGRPISLSALEHFEYCPRQCALITVDGVWADNAHTVRGQRAHRRVDEPGVRTERGRKVFRALPVWSEQLGLSGRADAIEVHSDGRVVPIEHKSSRRAGMAAKVQLCALALCLEEMLAVQIPEGQLWIGQRRRREPVALDDVLRRHTLEVIEAVRALPSSVRLPPPVNDARCPQCQLLDHCLPAVVVGAQALRTYVDSEVFSCGS
jgi:CRISPR-associated exonuclease Cas4